MTQRINAEISQRVIELMAYIHSVTESESEYESLLSQAAMELLDEAVLFDEGDMISNDTGDLFDTHDEDDELDDLEDILSWDDDWFGDDLDNDDDDNDTEYRQQADGRVL